MTRNDNREFNQARNVVITPDFTAGAYGSALIETGETKVICTASVENGVPGFLKGKGSGWLSAEYSMLPGSSPVRVRRERGKVGGRTQEIQRLIGRCLRAVLDLTAIGERTIWLDCDVIQADGGTRTAAVTGAYVALILALRKIKDISHFPIEKQVAAISMGVVDDRVLADLDYSEDSRAEVDLNIVMTDDNEIIEIQGTAEKGYLSRKQLDQMLDLSAESLRPHFQEQKRALGGGALVGNLEAGI